MKANETELQRTLPASDYSAADVRSAWVNGEKLSSFRVSLGVAISMIICLGVIFNLTNIDLWIASLFADDLNGFIYEKHWLADTVLHLYAARLTVVGGALLIGFNMWQWLAPSANKKTITACRYLMLSWASSLLAISILKTITTLPCPWNLKQFGGTSDYLAIYDLFSSGYSIGECFPSAHASGGYGLIGLGFIALILGRPMKQGFLVPILIGLFYGGAQIVRGAHFVSHDLFTLAISLSFAWFWAESYLFRSSAFASITNPFTDNVRNIAGHDAALRQP